VRFSAAYRSLLEALTVLLLTRIINDNDFASLIAEFYPIYFVANLLFSSSTVDFAGGQRKTDLTLVLLALLVPLLLIFAMFQDVAFQSLFFVLAGLTAAESIAFVFSESIINRTLLLLLLAPRVILASSVFVLFVMSAELSLDAAISMLIVRDLALVLIGTTILVMYRGELSYKVSFLNVKLAKVVYLVIANSHDLVLRIVVNNLIGPVFLKEFEYALRLPKIAQVGLMLALRHRIFAIESEQSAVNSSRVLLVQFVSALSSTVVFFAYQTGYVVAPFMIICSALLATSAVPWYTVKLHDLEFVQLTIAQLISFGATVIATIAFTDAYVSTFFMALVLFIFAFVHELNRKS
jgi:hypothetical protein